MGSRKIDISAEGTKLNQTDTLKYCIIQTNVWNATSINGVINLSLKDSELFSSINIKDIELKQRTIFAYPEVALGCNLMDDRFNDDLKKIIDFPIELDEALKLNIKLKTAFQIISHEPPELPFNVSYDFWIRRDINKHDHPEEHDCEIMIWLYRNEQKPIGKYTGDVVLKCKINGSEEDIKFSQWIGRGGRWLTISYIIDPMWQKEKIDLEIPLSSFLVESRDKMDQPMEKKYLMGMELGSEFGNPGAKKMKLKWKLSSYELIYKEGVFNLLEIQD